MRALVPFLVLSCLGLVPVAAVEPRAPEGPLSDAEKSFVGKWRGARNDFHWEIERKADRSFELAFVEPDPDRFLGRLKNYAVGVWWVDGKDYCFAWTRWWGDEGDFEGLQTEKIDEVGKDRVVTLSEVEEQGEDPRNVETRIEKFKLNAWELKPDDKLEERVLELTAQFWAKMSEGAYDEARKSLVVAADGGGPGAKFVAATATKEFDKFVSHLEQSGGRTRIKEAKVVGVTEERLVGVTVTVWDPSTKEFVERTISWLKTEKSGWKLMGL